MIQGYRLWLTLPDGRDVYEARLGNDYYIVSKDGDITPFVGRTEINKALEIYKSEPQSLKKWTRTDGRLV